MFDESRWAESEEIAKKVATILGCGENSAGQNENVRILDAGCGMGRISVELALLGFNVTGIDITKPYLQAAREIATDEGVNVDFVNADLRNFCDEPALGYKGTFDAVVNLYTSFGYCKTEEEDEKILVQIFKSLKKGGKFILECTSRETAIKFFTEGEWFKRAGNTVLTQFSVQGAWEGLRSTWILIDDKTGEKTEHTFVQRLYSAKELKLKLEKIGFSCVQIYGDYAFAPYDQNMKTMVIVAEK